MGPLAVPRGLHRNPLLNCGILCVAFEAQRSPMRSGAEIQGDLCKFVARWRDYSGSERSEAQTFLNELIQCYGVDRKAVGARFEDAHTATGIMDLHWPTVCIVEMKAPHRAAKLAEHRHQAFDYWHSSDDAALNRAAPPYVVLCAFQRFEMGTRPVPNGSASRLHPR